MDYLEYISFPVKKRKGICHARRRFGIELEVTNSVNKSFIKKILKRESLYPVVLDQGWGQSKGNCYWHIKSDATCGIEGPDIDKGHEIASPVGSAIKDIYHFAEIADTLGFRGADVNERCGLHIHAEARDLTRNQVAVIVSWWIKYERILLSIVDPLRNYSYCNLYKDLYPVDKNKSMLPSYIWNLICPQEFYPHGNPWRMRSINLVNFTKNKSNRRCTLEFRMPDGALEFDNIYYWILFFLFFIESFKNREMPCNFRSLSLPSALKELKLLHTNKTFYFLDNNLFYMKHWMLERIYDNSLVNGEDKLNLDAKNILNNMWNPIYHYS